MTDETKLCKRANLNILRCVIYSTAGIFKKAWIIVIHEELSFMRTKDFLLRSCERNIRKVTIDRSSTVR